MAELGWHRRNLRAIPVRVHVNGSRGKSSVTRLVAGGLRHAGWVACAKTTGTVPRMILADGREVAIERVGSPNVAEQLSVVAWARRQRAQALVLECMALRPALQWLSESKLVQATHGVLTNVRPDHLETMGPTEVDVARALCGTVPVGGTLYTAEVRHLATLRMACQDRRTRLVALDPQDCAAIGAETLQRFSYAEHPDNIALALRLLQDLGIERSTALAGMVQAPADPGALAEYVVHVGGRKLVFVNGFAANDPVSSGRIWSQMAHRHRGLHSRIALFNCRADRLDRALQLGQALADWPRPDYVVLMGGGARPFARAATAGGFEPKRLVFIGDAGPAEVVTKLLPLFGETALVMGLGNIGGGGLPLVEHMRDCAQDTCSARGTA
jgi:poly-gamma-glutamate synthase PgsB/CapB